MTLNLLPKKFIALCLALLSPCLAYGETPPLSPELVQADSTALRPSDPLSISPKRCQTLQAYFLIIQADGKWKKADRLIKQLDDRILLGHVLYQRYMHPTAYSSRYGSFPTDAQVPGPSRTKRIYALARKKNWRSGT